MFSSDQITTEYSTAASSKTSKTAADSYSETFESGGDSYESDFTESDASSVRKKKAAVNSASVQTDPVHVVQSDAMDPGGLNKNLC